MKIILIGAIIAGAIYFINKNKSNGSSFA